MEYRNLGRTGVKVSPLALGAMMFGVLGEPDHEKSIRIIHAALDAGINFVDTADVYLQGENEEIVGKALKGRRDDIVLATKFHNPIGDEPNQPRQQPALDHEGPSRTRCAACRPITSTSTRSTAPRRRPTSRRRCRRSRTSCAPARSATSARRRFPPARSSRRSGCRATAAWSASRPSSRRTRSSCAGSRPMCSDLPALWHRRDPVEPARGRLALGQVAEGRGASAFTRADRLAGAL